MSQASQYPLCRHIMPSGRRCQSPAMRDKLLCYYHSRSCSLVQANRPRKHSVALPPLEDRAAIQLSIQELLAAFAAGKFTRREFSTYLYAVDLASRNLTRMEQLPPPDPIELLDDGHADFLAADDPHPLPQQQDAGCPEAGCPGSLALGDGGTTESTIPGTTLGSPSPAGRRDNSPGRQPRVQARPPRSPAGTAEIPPPGPNLALGDPGDQGRHDKGYPIQRAASPLVGWESTNPSLWGATPLDSSHEFDPEPPPRLTPTQLRETCKQIDISLRNYYEGRAFHSQQPPSPGYDPAAVLASIQQNIDKLEARRRALEQEDTPDPPLPPIR